MFARLSLIIIFLTISACTNETRMAAPIVDKAVIDCSKAYRVKEGDKLFLLGWQCNINVDILADMNGISVSKPLTVGQVLKLHKVKNNAKEQTTLQTTQKKHS